MLKSQIKETITSTRYGNSTLTANFILMRRQRAKMPALPASIAPFSFHFSHLKSAVVPDSTKAAGCERESISVYILVMPVPFAKAGRIFISRFYK